MSEADWADEQAATMHRTVESVAAALREAEQRGREQAAREIEEPYPEDVFPELCEDAVKIACDTLQRLQRGLSDRLHAGWARHWAGVIRERGKE